jgi:molybdenum cofactor biosynthesis enzyme MoaA
MPGLNDYEAPALLACAMENDYEVRFIEQMPLDAQHGWRRDGMITAGDVLVRYALLPLSYRVIQDVPGAGRASRTMAR